MMGQRIMVFLTLLTIAGCGVLPERSQVTPTYYDLGIPEARELRSCCRGMVVIGSVRAVPMLGDQTMWYRRGEQSLQPAAFALNRWVAKPAALIEQYLRVALGVAVSERFDGTPFRLDVKVEALEQRFSKDLSSSSALLIASATISDNRSRRLIENRVIRLNQPVQQQDAAGGAAVHRELAERLVDAVQEWMCDVSGREAAESTGTRDD